MAKKLSNCNNASISHTTLPYESLESKDIDFRKEHISYEEKIKTIAELTKKYDAWFKDFSLNEQIKVVGTWIKDLVPFLNPHEIIEHPRLSGLKRRDVLPLA